METPELGPQDIGNLLQCLQEALSSDAHLRRQAEVLLESLRDRSGFCACLAVRSHKGNVETRLILLVVLVLLKCLVSGCAVVEMRVTRTVGLKCITCVARKSLEMLKRIIVQGGWRLSISSTAFIATGNLEGMRILAYLGLHRSSNTVPATCVTACVNEQGPQ